MQYANPIEIMNTTFTCSRLSLSDRCFSDMIMSRSITYLLKYVTVFRSRRCTDSELNHNPNLFHFPNFKFNRFRRGVQRHNGIGNKSLPYKTYLPNGLTQNNHRFQCSLAQIKIATRCQGFLRENCQNSQQMNINKPFGAYRPYNNPNEQLKFVYQFVAWRCGPISRWKWGGSSRAARFARGAAALRQRARQRLATNLPRALESRDLEFINLKLKKHEQFFAFNSSG